MYNFLDMKRLLHLTIYKVILFQFLLFIYFNFAGEKRSKEQDDKWAEMKQRKKERLLALVGNKAPTMGQVN